MIPRSVLSALRQTPSVDRPEDFALFLQGEVSLGLWMLESGSLHVSRVSGRGKSIVLDVLESGDLVGLSAAVSGDPSETSAVTAIDCRLRLLPRADFLRLLQHDAESSRAIVGMLAQELAAAHRWIGNTTLARSSSARLANFLLTCSPADLRALTHMDISLRIGVSREATSRLLHDFRASGAISPVRGCLAVRDRSLLRELGS